MSDVAIYYGPQDIANVIEECKLAYEIGNENLTKKDIRFLERVVDEYENTGEIEEEEDLEYLFYIVKKL